MLYNGRIRLFGLLLMALIFINSSSSRRLINEVMEKSEGEEDAPQPAESKFDEEPETENKESNEIPDSSESKEEEAKDDDIDEISDSEKKEDLPDDLPKEDSQPSDDRNDYDGGDHPEYPSYEDEVLEVDHPNVEDKEVAIDGDEENESEDESFPFHGSFFFDTPFFNPRQIGRYFQQMERALQRLYESNLAKAVNSSDSFTNSTEEIVEIGGKKYKVQKTIIKGGDANNTIFIEAIETHPFYNETETKIKKEK